MRQPSSVRSERGQVLVIFALALVAIVAMTGLVLDGGSTFVQRRDQQNVADSAAMAAGYAYSMGGNPPAVTAAARSTAASNGYVHGTGGVTVDVSMDTPGGPGRHLTVTVSKPHNNNFAGIVGMPSWGVTTTAMTLAGRPNGGLGAMPIIFNQKAFDNNGAGSGHEMVYGERAVRSGARGYLMKGESSQRVVSAIRSVLQGEVFLSERLMAQIASRLSHAKTTRPPIERLSDRELEVFQMLGQGTSTSAIAEKLSLSVKTVQMYVARAKEKFGVTSARELMREAVRWEEAQVK